MFHFQELVQPWTGTSSSPTWVLSWVRQLRFFGPRPSEAKLRRFLKSQDYEHDWVALEADRDAHYDFQEEIDLSRLEAADCHAVASGLPCPPAHVFHPLYFSTFEEPLIAERWF